MDTNLLCCIAQTGPGRCNGESKRGILNIDMLFFTRSRTHPSNQRCIFLRRRRQLCSSMANVSPLQAIYPSATIAPHVDHRSPPLPPDLARQPNKICMTQRRPRSWLMHPRLAWTGHPKRATFGANGKAHGVAELNSTRDVPIRRHPPPSLHSYTTFLTQQACHERARRDVRKIIKPPIRRKRISFIQKKNFFC